MDSNVERLKDKDILWADMVFIGGMAIQRTSAVQIIDRCKALNAPIAAGGPLFTSEPDHRSGLQVMGGFIVGFDSDKASIFQRQIDFIQKSGIVTAMVGMLQAIPGTRLFERLQKENRVLDFFSGDNVDGTTNIIPKMGMDNLADGYRDIMKQIYLPKNYYRRVRTQLRELKTPEIFQPMDFQRFLSFFRAAFWLGFFGKERFQYWYLLLWTLIRKPRLVPTAITLSIYGYHYRKICERYIY